MDTLKLFKIPLTYAGFINFINEFKQINKNTSDESIEDYYIKYKIEVKSINSFESEVLISLQEDNSIVIYKFRDKLITVPRLESKGFLIERTIKSKFEKIYLIDTSNHQILLIKYNKITGKGLKSFINPLSKDKNLKLEDLSKFITMDIEAGIDLELLEKNGDFTQFKPLMIGALNFYSNEKYHAFIKNKPDKEMESFLLNFFDYRLHKFVIYAHNLSTFDGVFILKHLVKLGNLYKFKIEPIFRDSKLIKIKCRFGDKNGKYRYYIEFHDSLLILNSSLKNLSDTFLKDSPELMKLDNEEIMEYLLNEKKFNKLPRLDQLYLFSKIKDYCLHDCISLANIIHRFALLIFNDFNLNIHNYPTISSLALNIYLTNYLKSKDLIPLISGEIYRDIRNAYHGGHTDVYQLYSNKDVHSYDYRSMYPSIMLNNEMPVGDVTKFEGNPLLCGETFKNLCDQHAIIKCSIYVDKSLNRPLYQTTVKMDGEFRNICATGTFHNQWVYLKEICKYYDLTNGLIRVIPNSISKGYLFKF